MYRWGWLMETSGQRTGNARNECGCRRGQWVAKQRRTAGLASGSGGEEGNQEGAGIGKSEISAPRSYCRTDVAVGQAVCCIRRLHCAWDHMVHHSLCSQSLLPCLYTRHPPARAATETLHMRAPMRPTRPRQGIPSGHALANRLPVPCEGAPAVALPVVSPQAVAIQPTARRAQGAKGLVAASVADVACSHESRCYASLLLAPGQALCRC